METFRQQWTWPGRPARHWDNPCRSLRITAGADDRSAKPAAVNAQWGTNGPSRSTRENAKWNKNQHQVSFNASLPAVSVAGTLHSQVLFAESGSEIAFCPKLT